MIACGHQAWTDAFYILKHSKQAESEDVFLYILWCQAIEHVMSELCCKSCLTSQCGLFWQRNFLEKWNCCRWFIKILSSVYKERVQNIWLQSWCVVWDWAPDSVIHPNACNVPISTVTKYCEVGAFQSVSFLHERTKGAKNPQLPFKVERF